MRIDGMCAINATEFETFVRALFPYAEEGTFLAYCAFHQFDRGRGRVLGEAGRVSGDPGDIVRHAVELAGRAANHAEPLVFCPPIATFKYPDGASTADLANGLAISVDVDKADPDAARARLEGLLGPATVVVRSGGEWVNPETGEVMSTAHLHWRLSEVTKTDEEHERLREARWLAARVVGADTSVASVVHPLRWPGSWNLKDRERPRQASIVACDSAREVHLDEALEALADAVALAGVEAAGGARAASGGADRDPRVAMKSQPPLALVVDALRHLPNPYDENEDLRPQRVRVAYALYAATGGSETGRRAWHEWNAKREDYDQAKVEERWESVRRSPPRAINGWVIPRLAKDRGWTAPTSEPPPDPVGYYDGVRDADFGRAAAPRKDAEAAGVGGAGAAGPRASGAPSPGEGTREQPTGAGGKPDAPLPGLSEFLSVYAWAERDIPEPDRLLGDLLTTTSRMFLVGRTGLGKTLVGVAMACGMAAGTGFLHWRSSRAARVLYVDGEMPGELIKARCIDVLRRADKKPPPGNLLIFSRDMEDEFARRFPSLGRMEPLNTEAGQNYIRGLIDRLGGVDVVVFDNVMSLLTGDMKDEVPWSETVPLVASLTTRRIGQVWLDHTGHNTDRQYGSAAKAWRFDAVGLMTALPDDRRNPRETAFQLSFEPPGKARRRTSDNWRDFETRVLRLRDDRWTSEPAEPTRRAARLSPMAEQFYRAFLDALATSRVPGQTTRDAWYAECVRTGIADAVAPDDHYRVRSAKQAKLRKYMVEIKLAGLIGVDGETVHDLQQEGQRP